MAITSSHVWVTLRYRWMSQQMQTKRLYGCSGTGLASVNAEDIGAAWWLEMSAAWRAVVNSDATDVFQSVFVEEQGGLEGFAEYAVPTAQKGGTRNPSGIGHVAASFLAVGVRFTVGTRRTRPGQMRVPFLYETDMLGQTVEAPFKALVSTLADMYAAPLVLPSPAADVTLTPQVPKFTGGIFDGLLSQNIIGYVVNDNLTTQNSRKIGRGI